MRHIVLLVLVFLTTIVGSSSAQVAGKSDIEATYKRQADFFLKYADSDGGLTCKLMATYDHKEKKYTLFLVKAEGKDKTDEDNESKDGKEKKEELLVLNDPLSFEYFNIRFFEELKKKLPSAEPLSGLALQSVFTWLYTLPIGNEDDIVNSGILQLKGWTMVFGTDNDNKEYKKSTLKREHHLDTVEENFISEQVLLVVLKKEIASIIESKKGSEVTDLGIAKETLKTAEDHLEIEKKAKINKDVVRNDLIKKLKATEVSIEEVGSEFGIPGNSDDSVIVSINKYQDSLQKKIASDSVFIDTNDITNFDADSLTKIKATRELDLVELARIKKRISEILTLTKVKAKLDAERKSLETEIGTIESQIMKYQEEVNKKSAIVKQKAEEDNKNTKLPLFLEKFKADRFVSNEGFNSNAKTANVIFSKTEEEIVERYFSEKQKFREAQKLLSEDNIFKIDKISLQFEKGYLERIQVWVNNGHGNDIYENIYAIGMSSINNYKNFNTTHLFIRKSQGAEGSSRHIMLSDAIGNYDNFLSLFTRDYSPGDTEINNVVPASTPYLTLRKERVVNLFDSKIFTDFAGLKEGNPNGLVQIDVSRRFNVNNFRLQVPGKRCDYGFFDNISVFGAITKIEQKEKRLMLRNSDKVVNGKIVSPSYATTLDLRQYENASLGTDLNVGLFDYPDGKFTVFFNLGLRYGHTPLEDSLRTVTDGVVDTPGLAYSLDAHSFTWQPKISMEFFAERRIGLVLTYQFNRARFYSNNNFKPIMSYAKSNPDVLPIESSAGYYHMYELFLRIETSRANHSKMFLRARYFKQHGDANTFFPQVQLGYAYNLVFRK